MAGETISPLPADLGSTWLYIDPERKVQVYPDPPEGGGPVSTRPARGQAWPRGNTRGNG